MAQNNEVIFKKYNEVFLHLSGNQSALREIHEYFTFDMPNLTYHPKVRSKQWDGKLRMLDMRTGLIYFGLKNKIIEFCKSRGFDCVLVDDADEAETSITAVGLKKYIDSLNLPYEIREYQLDALANMLRRGRSLTVSPTGSGKSFIIYCAIRAYTQAGLTGVLIVPTQGLVEQMYSDFKEYSKNNNWDVDANCHRLYSGYEKEFDKSLLITTWQSLINMDPEFCGQFRYVIGDECHQWEAKSFGKIGKRLVHAKFRTGFTGTLKDSMTHEMALEGMFGPIYYAETTAELIKQGYLAETHIKCLVLKHDEQTRSRLFNCSYQEEIEYITQNEKRNKFIADLASSLKGNTLVLFNFVENQGLKLHEMLQTLAPGRVHLIHGQIDTEVRENIRKILNSASNDILLASMGTFSIGQNVPNLHNGIFAHPSKSKIRNLQSLGRGLRLGENKDSFVLYDIADDLRFNDKMNYTFEHFMERLRIYDSEKFDYKLHKLDF